MKFLEDCLPYVNQNPEEFNQLAEPMQGYINEFAWRYNYRDSLTPLFLKLINRVK